MDAVVEERAEQAAAAESERDGDTPDAWVVARPRRARGPIRRGVNGLIDRWVRLTRSQQIEFGLTALVLALVTAYVASKLGPVLSDTTPAGGDMGAHVWGPAFLRDELLPQGRLSGWTPDWYAGFPAYQFYMVVPSLLILALDLVMPYGVAFKIVVVAGPLTLPFACALFGWLAGLRFPTPALLSVAGALFLFDTSFTIYGGNLASTMAGEFAFALSLSLAMVYLGVVARGLRTGKHRAIGAVLLALCGLCHIIPAFFALVATAVFLVMRWSWSGIRWVITMGPVAGLLSAFWVLPFAAREPFVNDMGWEKLTVYWENLFPPGMQWLVLAGLAGFVISFWLRVRVGVALGVLVMLIAVAFRFLPDGRLWNARVLPFYHLVLFLLIAIGFAELLRFLGHWFAESVNGPDRVPRLGIASTILVLGTFFGMGALMVDLHDTTFLPGARENADGSVEWLGFTDRAKNFVPGWSRWNFEGYEGKPAYREYHDIVQAMDDVGEEHGCGRAMWEYEPELDRYGTPMALMLLPFWTEGCIGSMEGLYFEASVTTPYHFLNQDQLSAEGSNAQRDLPYTPGVPSQADFDLGVGHLQMLGVRYYMAFSTTMLEYARSNPDLTELPGAGSPPWTVFLVSDSDLVVRLENQPVVFSDVDDGDEWLEPSVEWYQDPSRWDVYWASSGPDEWERVPGDGAAPREALPTVAVSQIVEETDSISFVVDRTDVPVLVRTSYFPNWKVRGAEGPYRVAPNLMVVIPTDSEVELYYGWTVIDILAWTLTVLGVAALIALIRAGPIDMSDRAAVRVDPAEFSADPLAVELAGPDPRAPPISRVAPGVTFSVPDAEDPGFDDQATAGPSADLGATDDSAADALPSDESPSDDERSESASTDPAPDDPASDDEPDP